jgi:hypothetical protein
MVRRVLLRSGLVALALIGAKTTFAAQIQFTGNVETDFPQTEGIGIITDNPIPNPTGPGSISNPNDVAQAAWVTQAGWTTGWNIKDIRVHYDQASDTMAVGVNFFGIAGDSDGNGDPNVADPRTTAAGGLDEANLGFDPTQPAHIGESITVGFDINGDHKPDIIAGVPADKSQNGPGLLGFSVNKYAPSNAGLAYNYGTPLNDHNGGLAFIPDAQHPGFEFTIKNFTSLPGLSPSLLALNGIGITAFAGTPFDVVAGEDSVTMTHLSPQAIPEPASLLAWSVAVGAAAFGVRRRNRRAKV